MVQAILQILESVTLRHSRAAKLSQLNRYFNFLIVSLYRFKAHVDGKSKSKGVMPRSYKKNEEHVIIGLLPSFAHQDSNKPARIPLGAMRRGREELSSRVFIISSGTYEQLI